MTKQTLRFLIVTSTILVSTLFMACGQSHQSISDLGPSNPTVDGGHTGPGIPNEGLGLPCVKAKLSWTPPLTRLDGSAITSADLGGYKIYVGVESQNYASTFNLADGSATTYTVTGLTQNETYYFSIKAYDINGNESPASGEVTWVARKQCE